MEDPPLPPLQAPGKEAPSFQTADPDKARLQGEKLSLGPCLVLKKQSPVCCHMRISQIITSSDFPLSDSVGLKAEALGRVSGVVAWSGRKGSISRLPEEASPRGNLQETQPDSQGHAPNMSQSGEPQATRQPPARHLPPCTVSSPSRPQRPPRRSSTAGSQGGLAKHSAGSVSWGPAVRQKVQAKSPLGRGWGAPCGSKLRGFGV